MKGFEKEEKQLSNLIKTMDVPTWRRDTSNQHNLFWLAKNLGIRNSKHEKYDEAIKTLKSLLRQYWK